MCSEYITASAVNTIVALIFPPKLLTFILFLWLMLTSYLLNRTTKIWTICLSSFCLYSCWEHRASTRSYHLLCLHAKLSPVWTLSAKLYSSERQIFVTSHLLNRTTKIEWSAYHDSASTPLESIEHLQEAAIWLCLHTKLCQQSSTLLNDKSSSRILELSYRRLYCGF